ncbi:MAG: hypothetical protein ACJ76I_05215 [Gaiellaceae bacterium]
MASSTGILGGLLDSPRKQRRFFILSAAVFAAGVIAFVALVLLRGTSNAYTDTISSIPAQLSKPDKAAPVSKDEIALARTFIRTAVARKNLDAAYSITHPDLRGTMTRKEWDTGNIPVITYPARNIESTAFTVVYSYTTSALLEVDLVAQSPTDQTRPHLRFFIGVKREGDKPTGRWLVNYWQPHWRPPLPPAVG